ncbi:MAG: hypothetical protein ABSH35_05455 [Isosphaeraceae bacterium]|jgi:hypothetical protein
MPAGSSSPEVERIASDVETGRQQVLVILFIPSHDRDEKELKTRDLWADAALNLFADLFGGATAFDTYAGIYRDKSRGKDLKDKPILVEAYTEIERVRNLDVLNNLVSFMKRMGKEAKQAAVAVVINNVFHEITNF